MNGNPGQPSDSEPAQFLPWDSEFFHLRIGRALSDRLDEARAGAIQEWCLRNQIDCLYFPARSDDPQTVSIAQIHDFRLADFRITLDRAVDPSATSVPVNNLVHQATAADVPALRRLAAVSHRDSRFYRDGHFPTSLCDELYARWITASVEGLAQAVFVVESAGYAAGYITCELKESQGKIGLIAVDPSHARTGLGGKLMERALSWMASHGADEVSVVTQGSNIPAQRLYQRYGFRTCQTQLYYHKWYR